MTSGLKIVGVLGFSVMLIGIYINELPIPQFMFVAIVNICFCLLAVYYNAKPDEGTNANLIN